MVTPVLHDSYLVQSIVRFQWPGRIMVSWPKKRSESSISDIIRNSLDIHHIIFYVGRTKLIQFYLHNAGEEIQAMEFGPRVRNALSF